MRCYLGVDPGSSGAFTVMGEGGQVIRAENFTTFPVASGILKEYKIVHAAVEQVSGRSPVGRKAGTQGMFKFGMNYGGWLVMLAEKDIPVTLVTPAAWQKHMLDVPAHGDKQRIVDCAVRLIPSLSKHIIYKKDYDKADAALIALYCVRSLADFKTRIKEMKHYV